MKKSVYINSVGSVSAQKTFDDGFLENIEQRSDTVLAVVAPNYKDYIPPAAARRMAKGIKMSTVSAKNAMQGAGVDENEIDAIIVGTGLGCIGDSEKFVSDIIDNNEQFLTPTRFIQSSHNTVAGQIALGIGCKGYNFTYVHSAVSFESAVLDAKMQLEQNEARTILVGGVDELVDHHVSTHRLIGHIKEEPVDTMSVLKSGTSGAVFSEGAHFFVLSNQKRTSCYAELMALKTFNTLSPGQLGDNVGNFLKEQGLTEKAIDLIVLGYNGDVEFDGYYDILAKGPFSETPQAYFKHLSGEFDTASGFGFWVANKILKHQRIPDPVKLNDLHRVTFETVLIYNQYRGENHSLMLLKKC
ncbi:beta-ketoacyl synthase N-terminal-like domain-containing protein [Pseudozobellia thermophila]|uniref:3-oxoacyl-(Acyl-carrier-protein) synthase n=1 Tax=Pseudozobellia thermophila TaxID=192903 RepID=A0A1M6CKB8_9FLAO|nr:beta-ketoacyl synthase N-terminal-like domain-containing protein [Pseudozobellia thermophila]SHI61460.1 3-oxoacyl-(acyl-carrier-protein) synthase [Pseudozobellia thermophila]